VFSSPAPTKTTTHPRPIEVRINHLPFSLPQNALDSTPSAPRLLRKCGQSHKLSAPHDQ
jgi:hypothetical protein